MPLTDEEKAAQEKIDKTNGLKEIQNRLLAMETEFKKVKGADAENIRAIAKSEMAALEQEINNLRLALTPKPATEEKGFFADFWPF